MGTRSHGTYAKLWRDVWTHQKSMALAASLETLGVPEEFSRREAVGQLHELLCWAIAEGDEAGTVGHLSAYDFCRVVGFRRHHLAAELVAAWRSSGFLDELEDGSIVIHDLEEACRDLYRKRRERAAAAEKASGKAKKKASKRAAGGRPAGGRRAAGGRPRARGTEAEVEAEAKSPPDPRPATAPAVIVGGGFATGGGGAGLFAGDRQKPLSASTADAPRAAAERIDAPDVGRPRASPSSVGRSVDPAAREREAQDGAVDRLTAHWHAERLQLRQLHRLPSDEPEGILGELLLRCGGCEARARDAVSIFVRDSDPWLREKGWNETALRARMDGCAAEAARRAPPTAAVPAAPAYGPQGEPEYGREIVRKLRARLSS